MRTSTRTGRGQTLPLLAVTVALAWLLAACSPGAEHLDVVEFQELTEQPGVVTLDVRTPAEFAQGHLDGAINIDAQGAGFEAAIAELEQDVGYALYCQSGRRSADALTTMGANGFDTIADLAGGLEAWQAAGLPVVR